MKLVLATRNQGKVREFQQLLGNLGIDLCSLDDFPSLPDVEEDGLTFRENAEKKAVAVARATGLPALADDSGLEVDQLHGAPGVHSARFAGEPKDDGRNNQKLLELLRGVAPLNRTARFRCVIALATPEGQVTFAEGTCEGLIGERIMGEGGFGYDPLFYVPEYGQTFGQLSPEIKNTISHRAKALEKIAQVLKDFMSH